MRTVHIGALFLLIVFLFEQCKDSTWTPNWDNVTAKIQKTPVAVELFAQRYRWTIRYAGEDNTLGKFDYKLTTDENDLGLVTTSTIEDAIAYYEHLTDTMFVSPKTEHEYNKAVRIALLLKQMKTRHDRRLDKNAWDDIIVEDTFYLCKGTRYLLTLRSKDVIHSAYFPEFRVQMNVVPGSRTQLAYTPEITTEEKRRQMNDPEFNFYLICNRICGEGCSRMKMPVVVVNSSDYQRILNKYPTFSERINNK